MIFGSHQENTLEQFDNIQQKAEKAALMADGHLGYLMPVGGVAAYDNKVSVPSVGYDIACGNVAVRTDLDIEDIYDYREEIAHEISRSIAFGKGRSNKHPKAPRDHPLFESPSWEAVPPKYRHNLRERARAQLGSVGSGNHYVDIFEDGDGVVWIGIHFGSRGFGYNVAKGFMALAQDLEWGTRSKSGETLLDLDTPLGQDYWSLMRLAGEYAYAGRDWVGDTVLDILNTHETLRVHNNHNFAWKETHDGRDFVVIRKGATPAFPGQLGFVGGSMGDNAVILKGKQSDLSKDALYSTVHGAGRVMSRTEAKGKTHRKTGRVIKEAKVTKEMMDKWLEEKDVVLIGGGLDESPHAYRRLSDVLEAQGDTINVLYTLKPHIVVMAND